MTKAENLRQAWSVFAFSGACVEVRAPKAGKNGTVSGYFSEETAFCNAIAAWDGKVPGLYATLNPVKPELLARRANRMETYAKETTADADILARHWFPIDFDPVRASGISSTDAEHHAAIERATACREWLLQAYSVDSVLLDSGNGAHLLVRVALPNTTETTAQIKAALEGIAAKFTDDGVIVDTSVANAARIWKIPGTLACKGDNLPERPHRRAQFVAMPEASEPVPLETLTALSALRPLMIQEPSFTREKGFELRERLTQWGVSVDKEADYQGGRKLILEVCPFNSDHHAPDAAVFVMPSGALGFRCQHNSCQGRTWQDVREHFEPGYRDRAARPVQSLRGYEITRKNERSPHSEGVTSLNSSLSSSITKENRPAPLHEAAYHGIVGDFVRTIEPHTESDPVAILVQFLIAFGCVIGRNAFCEVEASQHYGNLFTVLVGRSARGRKGTSWGWVRRAFASVDETWEADRVVGGLSSGEGLIHAVRDPVEKMMPIKEKGRIVDYQKEIVDEGVSDKRLLATEEEFARTLQVMEREANPLSAVIRQAWDSGKLRVMTKNPTQATDAHISIIGHITRDELRRLMTDTAKTNGFGNRFLWMYVERSKELPNGGNLNPAALDPIIERIRKAVAFGRQVHCFNRDAEAGAIWNALYSELTREEAGMIGILTNRSDPIVLRLSLLYALLDCSLTIRKEHLAAAMAVWEYAAQSVRYVFGDALGDPVADEILRVLRETPEGMTRSELSTGIFNKNQSAEKIGLALQTLLMHGLAVCVRDTETGGRPAERWQAVPRQEQEQ